MESGKGMNSGKKNKLGTTPDFNYEEYQKYIQPFKKENQKELALFFLNELIGEYGYKAVVNSLDNIPTNECLDNTIRILTEKLGKEIFQDNIYYYRNINVIDYKNTDYKELIEKNKINKA